MDDIRTRSFADTLPCRTPVGRALDALPTPGRKVPAMPRITYDVRETLGRGLNYAAQTIIAERCVTLGHYLLDNYTSVQALKTAVAAEAPALLRGYWYTAGDIATWLTQEPTDKPEQQWED